jgi:hypothetical protein
MQATDNDHGPTGGISRQSLRFPEKHLGFDFGNSLFEVST